LWAGRHSTTNQNGWAMAEAFLPSRHEFTFCSQA
jgi:hypothetical protein